MLNRVLPRRVPPVFVSSPSVSPIVRAGSEADLNFVLHWMRKEHDALGFMPREAVQTKLARGDVVVATENGELAGYCLFGKSYAHARFIRPIFQACVDFDARRQKLGLELVGAVERDAVEQGQSLVRLWCRASLPANVFWKAAGYELAGQREGGAKRKTPCNLWVKRVRPMCAAEVVLALQPARGTAGVYATPAEVLQVRPAIALSP